MADENETKIRDAVGPNGTESPAQSPVDVLAMSGQRVPVSVYVMSAEGRTKIGISNNVAYRQKSVEMAIGIPVSLHGSRLYPSKDSAGLAERQLHREFADRRLLGEWFAILPEEALAALDALPLVLPAPPRQVPDVLPDYDDYLMQKALAHLEKCARKGKKDIARTACSRVVRA